MQRFFLSDEKIDCINKAIKIDGNDAAHIIKSLRMKIGEKLVVCDMRKDEFECEISAIDKGSVILKILITKKNDTEPDFRAYLYQALPKGDKMDYIVQKAVELGVYEIIPFVSERCISRPDAESCLKKTVRWRKIAEEAAKQCGRGVIPTVRGVIDYKAALEEIRGGSAFLCYEGDETEQLGDIIKSTGNENGTEIKFIIGPEGGFGLNEIKTARRLNVRLAGLGKRILRCETAAGFVLSCLVYERELRR